MEMHAWKKSECLLAPPDTLAGRWESREAYIQAPWEAPPRIIIYNNCEMTIQAHNKIYQQQQQPNQPICMYYNSSSYMSYINTAAVVPAAKKQYI